MRRALITGIGGQDGSYLAEYLLSLGYEVYGVELPDISLPNLDQIIDKIVLYRGSMIHIDWLRHVVESTVPDECYHLAASSFVSYLFEDESQILNNNIESTHNILALLKEQINPCRIFFAGTSEMFGSAEESPQNEKTPFRPSSVYGISKVTCHNIIQYYRRQHGVFSCTGICYNHESPRRGFIFVTRKITSTVAKIKLGLEKKITLGNLDALRDWGYAPDYVRAMWLMLQKDFPDDYVIASGEIHSVREFVEVAFDCVGLDYRKFVEIDSRFFREAEIIPLKGDTKKALELLDWHQTKTFKEIISEMVDNDLKLFNKL